MDVSRTNNIPEETIGASVFAPVSPEDFYRALLDVRGFPAWAPGVRRVEVLANPGGAGMVSEWEVSLLGLKRKVLSVLLEAESPSHLRWTYEGPVRGWGECFVNGFGDGTLVEFRTELAPTDSLVARLVRGNAARDAARGHLRRALLRLGRVVAGDGTRVLVGPATRNGPRPKSPKPKAREAGVPRAQAAGRNLLKA